MHSCILPETATHTFNTGKTAGGVKLLWYNMKCDDDTLQLKIVISESRSEDSGEYMCIRLTLQQQDVIGLVVRQG